MSESDAKEWAAAAAAQYAGPAEGLCARGVFVVLFSDGEITNAVDPITGEKGFADWSFSW